MRVARFRAAWRVLIAAWLRHERGRTALTLLGVALGVAVLVAIGLANESAVASFKDTLDDVAGRAALTVRGNGIGLDAKLLAEIGATPGVHAVAPLILGHATWTPPGSSAAPETLLLLGVDFLRSTEPDVEPVRDLRFAVEPGRAPASFVSDPAALVFTRRFAERAGAGLGGAIELELSGARRAFRVGAWIESGPFADTLDGRVAIADIGIVDALLGRRGLVDRFDLVLESGADPEAVARELRGRLAGSVLVERPETRGAQVDEMLAAFRFNLEMLGRIAIVVGAFLIYNTMSIAVVRRRNAIGTLRALGLPRGTIAVVFLGEGLLFGALGGLLGVALGVALARAMLSTVSTAVSINFFETRAGSVALSPPVLLGAVGFATLLSLVAALGPAREAATTPPANTMRAGSLEARRRPLGRAVAIGLALLLLAALACALPSRPGLPLRGYVAAIALLAASLAWCRPALGLLVRLLRRPYARLFRAEGLLAAGSIESALGRASVAIAGLVVALAMTVALTVMVASFRDTVIDWMGHVLRADLYLSTLAPLGRVQPEPLPAALADRLAAIPGIEAVDPFRARRVTLRGREAWLGAGRLDVVRFTNRALDGRPAAEVLREARANDGLILSEALARKLGLGAGDRLAIPTPQGDVELTVAGVYLDYSSEQGYAIMDRELYLRYFDDPLVDSIALYLETGADRAEVRRAIDRAAREVPGTPPLAVRANDELRAAALAAFNRTFAITWALEIIAIVVSVLGVTTTLLAQILDRRQEIASLRWLGATRARVARIVVLESSFIGLAGAALGTLAGIGLAWILARVIMLDSFGWTLAHRVPPLTVLATSGTLLLATLLAGLLPAREAARVAGVTGLPGGR